MAQRPDYSKEKRNEHLLKKLPTEVLLKARSTLFSLSGALKSKHDHQTSTLKHEPKNKKSQNLKISRSEPEFGELQSNRRRSRADGIGAPKVYGGARPRPKSVGPIKLYNNDEEFQVASELKDMPSRLRQFDSSEDVCVQSRLVIPVGDRFGSPEISDVSERPRKKLSFREPEIVPSGNLTLGRSNKHMGVNSLSRKPNRLSLRAEVHSPSTNGLDSDLESQAMRIVRTVGQAFEVCHKMQINTPEQAAASTSSAADDLAYSDRTSDQQPNKEAVSDCAASEASTSTSKVVVEVVAEEKEKTRPTHLELLPPPPRKTERRTTPQRPVLPVPVAAVNLPWPDAAEPASEASEASEAGEGGEAGASLSAQHRVQLLEERLENQTQQTRAAVAQLFLLRDQLAAEQAARREAQARTHQLLAHNKELLEHIAALVAHLQDRERGSSKPISAQQLTLLPQKGGTKKKSSRVCNGDTNGQASVESLIDLISHTRITQNVENNNDQSSAFNSPGSPPGFGNMTNEQIQTYLIAKFQNGNTDGTESPVNNNNATLKHSPFYQNRSAFPNVPPVIDNFNNCDIADLLNIEPYTTVVGENNLQQAMSVGQSEQSLYSASHATTSKDSTPCSSDDGNVPFIMPLSHNGTLTATGEDGRVRLIVPVSPSGSTSDVPQLHAPAPAPQGNTLAVPEVSVAYAAPITRSTSEKVPNHSQMMTALRQQWTRHTTK